MTHAPRPARPHVVRFIVMKLIVGLGNPGSEYHATRHNVGFVALDRLARRYAPGAVAKSKFHGVVIEARLDDTLDDKVLLLKPLTFMNRSGLAVSEAVAFYKLVPASDVLVIVDDIALPCGSIRIRGEGGAGGHNGLGDIQQKLGTQEYARLRIGIDAPASGATPIPQQDYVLGRFRPDQADLVDRAIEEAVDAAACWAGAGLAQAMNRFNRRESQPA
jgi:peptidyl-tRNA hydrolase, PTH1 family